MLHILLLILKIIGWILLAILSLAVLLTCVVLFVPFKYKAEGSCDGDISTLYGRIRFSWLLHFVGGYAVYKNGEFNWKFRIAWKKLQNIPYGVEEAEEAEAEVEEEEEAAEAESTSGLASKTSEHVNYQDTSKEKFQEISEKKPGDTSGDIPEQEHRKKGGGESEKGIRLFQKIIKRIEEIYEKIKYTFHKIYVTIKVLLHRKEKLLLFVTDETHKSAFWAVLMELRRLLRFLKPGHLKIRLCFGFSDPAITGQVLALASMLYPYVKGHKELTPDFEQEILKGTVAFSGKIRVVYAVLSFCKLLLNKEVRKTYRHIRKFKL